MSDRRTRNLCIHFDITSPYTSAYIPTATGPEVQISRPDVSISRPTGLFRELRSDFEVVLARLAAHRHSPTGRLLRASQRPHLVMFTRTLPSWSVPSYGLLDQHHRNSGRDQLMPPPNSSGVAETSSLVIRRGGTIGTAPPPGSWGRTLPLTREANPSPRISRHFPSAYGPSPPGVAS